MKKPLIILTGPTAVGKTSLSVKLAKAVNGEIISADSMQVYRHMDIGSAKITREEMDGVPHHLIDVLEPKDEFHVMSFQQMAREAMKEIYENGRIPILTGGTGFYIQAVVKDVDFSGDSESSPCRKRLEQEAQERGNAWMHKRLLEVDPVSAEKIHENNVKRVIRALEYYELTGEPISRHNEREAERESPYNYAYFILNTERSLLYKRIDQRVDKMLKDGLVDEVRALKEMGCTRNMVSMQGLGYKEILSYLEGEASLEEAVYILKRDTRHFAKRQLTWFRREKDVIWLEKEAFQNNEEQILEYMIKICKERGIISCTK